MATSKKTKKAAPKAGKSTKPAKKKAAPKTGKTLKKSGSTVNKTKKSVKTVKKAAKTTVSKKTKTVKKVVTKKTKPVKKDALIAQYEMMDEDVDRLTTEEIDAELAAYENEKGKPRDPKTGKALPESEAMQMCRRVTEYMFEKKAEDVVIADLEGLSSAADFFVICTATSDMHAKAIADNVEDRLAQEGAKLHHKEGHQSLKWVLLDYVDVIVHVFQKDARSFYDLERLWGDAKFTKVRDTAGRA